MGMMKRVEITSRGEGTVKIKVLDEDFTLANLLQSFLNSDSRVKGAGVIEPHPLEKSIAIQVYYKSGDIKEILQDAIDRGIRNLRDIRQAIEGVLRGQEAT